MNTNAGAAKPDVSGKLAGRLLAPGPFYTKAAQRRNPIEAMNERTLRDDRRRELCQTAIFWLKIAALCIVTLAAMQIANKAIANVAHTINHATQEQ